MDWQELSYYVFMDDCERRQQQQEDDEDNEDEENEQLLHSVESLACCAAPQNNPTLLFLESALSISLAQQPPKRMRSPVCPFEMTYRKTGERIICYCFLFGYS